MCSITYELLLARLFAVMSDREIVWHSLTIAIYVAALGVGTLLAERTLGRGRTNLHPATLLLIIELALVVLGSAAVFFVWSIHTWLRLEMLPEIVSLTQDTPIHPVDITIFIGQMACFAIGVLSGFEIPLLARLYESGRRQNIDPETRILGVNYLGTLGGTLLFLYVLTPFFTLGEAAWITAMANFAGAVVLLALFEAPKLSAPAALTALGISALVGVNLSSAEQLALKATYYISVLDAKNNSDFQAPTRANLKNFNPVLVERSPYQTLHMVRPPRLETAANRLLPGVPFTLYIDRHFQIASQHEALYHEFFVHYPIGLMAKVPEKILILGAGDGLATRELLRYEGVKSITQVELDPMMISLAKTHPAFTNLNKNSLLNPKVTLVQDDAFTYLKRNTGQYDAIFIDFPYPFSFDLSRLYSLEFYSFVRRNLNAGGFAVLDMPLIARNNINQSARVINDIFASTLTEAGFPVVSPFGGEGATTFDLETFMIALPEVPQGAAPPFKKPSIPFRYLYNDSIRHYRHRDFEININRKLVHSLFKPTLLTVRNVLL